MSSPYVPTGIWNVQKVLQIVEESDSAYGAKVTASPSYNAAGLKVFVQENSEALMAKFWTEGRRDMYRAVKYGEIHGFNVRTGLIDTRLLRYGSELPNGSGTIAKSLNFLYSQLLDNGSNALAEYFQFYLGARCDQTDLQIKEGVIELNQQWVCQNIPAIAAASGLTTPTHATTPTGDPWTSATSGLLPLDIDSTKYDTPDFKCSWKFKLESIRPNGNVQIKMLWPTTREIAGSFKTWWKGTTLRDAAVAMTNYNTLTYTLNATGPKTVALSNLRIHKRVKGEQTSDNKHTQEDFDFTAESSAVTA